MENIDNIGLYRVWSIFRHTVLEVKVKLADKKRSCSFFIFNFIEQTYKVLTTTNAAQFLGIQI